MCTFITALLPASTSLTAVAPYFENHNVGFTQITNPSLIKQITPGDIYLLTTRGMCDCGTPPGRLQRLYESNGNEAVEVAKQAKRLRKKEWSEAKIQRWREQKAQAPAQVERLLRENQELEQWLAFIPGLLHSSHTPRIGLLLHYYSGSVQNEQIKLKRQERVPMQNLNAYQLLHLCYDVVYEYV